MSKNARIENAMDAAFGLRTDQYRVERIGGTPGKHDDCDYFVLDWMHDPYAVPAALAYADACEAKYPKLAYDLRIRAARAAGQGGAERRLEQVTTALREATCNCVRDPSDPVQADNMPGHHDWSCDFRKRMQPVLAGLQGEETS